MVRDGAVVDSVAGIPGIRAAAAAAPRVRFVDPPASDLATTVLGDDGYCMRDARLGTDKRRAMSEALVADTLGALGPVPPDRVSDVRGPYIEVHQLSDNTIDVQVVHQFKAHFSNCRALAGAASGEAVRPPGLRPISARRKERPSPHIEELFGEGEQHGAPGLVDAPPSPAASNTSGGSPRVAASAPAALFSASARRPASSAPGGVAAAQSASAGGRETRRKPPTAATTAS